MSKHTLVKLSVVERNDRMQVMMDDGTWFFATDALIVDEHGRQVADVSSFHNDDGSPYRKMDRIAEWEVEANARLMAASPDLFALAERVANLNEHAGEIGAGMLASLIEDARAEVAKATGGEG